MASATEYQKRLQPLLNQSNLEQIVAEIVLSDKKRLKEEKINEWEQGIRPDGDKIGTYRDPEYAIFKDNINPRANGYVDLLLTRQTANSLFVHRSNQPRAFLFGMNDRYNLVGKYGNDILGLNQETFEKRQADIYRYTFIYVLKKDYKIA